MYTCWLLFLERMVKFILTWFHYTDRSRAPNNWPVFILGVCVHDLVTVSKSWMIRNPCTIRLLVSIVYHDIPVSFHFTHSANTLGNFYIINSPDDTIPDNFQSQILLIILYLSIFTSQTLLIKLYLSTFMSHSPDQTLSMNTHITNSPNHTIPVHFDITLCWTDSYLWTLTSHILLITLYLSTFTSHSPDQTLTCEHSHHTFS